jgi:ubiquinone/menaquinone biosynthesis C-methylase UbiE
MEHGGEAQSPEEGVASWAALFDRAARISPEGSVALYSLGNPDLLRAATAEAVDLLRGWGVLGADARVLDLGCGIGRFAEALAPHVAEVVGVDASAEMISLAKERLGSFPNARFMQVSGQNLAEFEAERFDLVLAVDVFPYLVQAGLALAETHIREAARLLRTGGSLAIFNFSYRGDLERDRADLARFAAVAGFIIERNADALLSQWDAAVFHLRNRR